MAKKTLTFQFALNDELRKKYKDLIKRKKKSIAEVLKGNIMRKYGLISKVSKILKIEAGRSRTKKGTLTEHDDISRMTSGIKETVTRHGTKKQKRIMTDTLSNVYEKFLLENTGLSISYS